MSNNIRHYREERGLSIRALADKLGVHFTTIGKMERSERSVSLDWLVKIAEILEVQPGDLIASTSPSTPAVNMVPLLGRIPAGGWREAAEAPLGFVPAPSSKADLFALAFDKETKGQVFGDGGYVVVDSTDKALREGLAYAVRYETGDTIIMRFLVDPARLEPSDDSRDAAPVLLGAEPITVIGRATWEVRPI